MSAVTWETRDNTIIRRGPGDTVREFILYSVGCSKDEMAEHAEAFAEALSMHSPLPLAAPPGLPEKYHDLWTLLARYQNENLPMPTYREIALVLGTSAPSVGTWVRRLVVLGFADHTPSTTRTIRLKLPDPTS